MSPFQLVFEPSKCPSASTETSVRSKKTSVRSKKKKKQKNSKTKVRRRTERRRQQQRGGKFQRASLMFFSYTRINCRYGLAIDKPIKEQPLQKHNRSAFLCICRFGDWSFSYMLPLWRLKLSVYFHLGECYWKDFSSPADTDRWSEDTDRSWHKLTVDVNVKYVWRSLGETTNLWQTASSLFQLRFQLPGVKDQQKRKMTHQFVWLSIADRIWHREGVKPPAKAGGKSPLEPWDRDPVSGQHRSLWAGRPTEKQAKNLDDREWVSQSVSERKRERERERVWERESEREREWERERERRKRRISRGPTKDCLRRG